MDIDLFQDLRLLAKMGNFSQAAEQAHISQSAFSRRIRLLENWVGLALVDRSRHPVSLNNAGKQMLEAGEQAILRIEQERRQLLELQSLPDKYVVNFGVPHSIGWRFFPAWLQRFEDEFGPIMSRLRADDLPGCVEALEQKKIDFVISYQSRYVQNLSQRFTAPSLIIGQDTLLPVSKTDINGKPIFTLTQENKLKIPWLRFGNSAPITRHLEPVLHKAGLHHHLGVVYENTLAGALRIRVCDGMGIAWLPKSLIAPDLQAGLLSVIGKKEWQIPMDICLFRLTNHHNALTDKIWRFLLPHA